MVMRALLFVLVCLAGPAAAQDQSLRALTATEIREYFAGSTFSGSSTTSDAKFSEYYLRDGRIFGDGGSGPITDGCWTIRDGSMCFAYGRGADRQTHCWRVMSNGQEAIFVNGEDGVDFIGTIERGNPRNHAASRSWTCGASPIRFDMMSPR